ncbi:MAG: phosphoesterase [Verrucomicrobia bacterium]|nr:phosphoesterase [Verrucomicrobiota bacterium]
MLLNRTQPLLRWPFLASVIAVWGAAFPSEGLADSDGAVPAKTVQQTFISTGQYITPTAAPGSVLEYLNPGLKNYPNFIASGALSSVKSPDGKTLLVLVSGYNSLSVPTGQTEGTNEYVFVFDISAGRPAKKQVLQIPNSYVGICFAPDGRTFYVGGGQDDNVHVFTRDGGGRWAESGAPIALGHVINNTLSGLGLFPGDVRPETAGLAITPDGSKLLVANYENDSLSIVDPKARKVITDVDLRPGVINKAQTGVPGGEFPFWVVLKGSTTAYISSIRDREIDVVDLSGSTASVTARIKVSGNPNKMILDRAQAFLYVTEDNSDVLDVINTTNNAEEQSVRVTAPINYSYDAEARYPGGSPNSLAFSPDESTLYVTNYGTNALSVVRGLPYHPVVVGLIPTGFAPNAVTVSDAGNYLYVSNGRGRTGPNPGYTYFKRDPNQYVYDLENSSLLTIPVPGESELATLTEQVAANDFFKVKQSPAEVGLMAELHKRIKHIIYLEKENRTYDQILGDLDRGNGDPALTDFGQAITPNYHRICQQFVDLDNFYCSGDVSGDGQIWSFAGRQSDISQKNIAINYGHGGTSYDSEGTNRDIIVGLPTVNERKTFNPATPNDPNLLPGTADEFAVDGPFGTPPQKGYIWDAALRAGLTIRNYGMYCDETRYSSKSFPVPLERNPAAKHLRVAFPAMESLIPHTDPYFRSFDNAFPDYWREIEWEREFAEFVKNGNLPALSLVRHMHDHMGSFKTAIDGVNTPELQQADNDYAVARLIDKVAHSPYKYDTLICILEDDSQDGADHVDSHRSTVYIVGPYVKHGAVISERYTTVNMIRTLEDILGTDHLNIRTANQGPMSAVFDLNQREWDFTAEPSTYLYNTALPLSSGLACRNKASIPKPTHDAAYWARRTAGLDFSKEDAVDADRFNRIIWVGLHPHQPYPTKRSGLDLRNNRAELLRKAKLTAAATAAGS